MMRMLSSLKILASSYVPVVGSIYVMILFRAQDLANETVNAGLEPGFFNPTTATAAVYSGFIIWTIGALFVGILALSLFEVLRRYSKIDRTRYLAITLALAVLMSIGLYVNKVPFAPEGAYEMFACGIGFGILIPYFSSREASFAAGS
jgi:hypothetical protein